MSRLRRAVPAMIGSLAALLILGLGTVAALQELRISDQGRRIDELEASLGQLSKLEARVSDDAKRRDESVDRDLLSIREHLNLLSRFVQNDKPRIIPLSAAR